MPVRQWADPAPLILVYPNEEEAAELLLLIVQDADRGVARARELARRTQHGIEHRLEVELCHEGPANVEEPAELRFAEPGPRGEGHITAGLRHGGGGYRSGIAESIAARPLAGWFIRTLGTAGPGSRAPRRRPTLDAMSHASHGPVLIGYDGYDEAAAAIRVAGRLLGSRTATVAYVWESLAAAPAPLGRPGADGHHAGSR